MSDDKPTQGKHADPAEPKQVDTAVDTSKQDEPKVEAVEVAPADPAVKTDNVHGVDYEVTPERGYRVVKSED